MKKSLLFLTSCLVVVGINSSASKLIVHASEVETNNIDISKTSEELQKDNPVVPQTEEEIKASQEKMRLAEEHANNKSKKRSWGGTRIYPASSRKTGSGLGNRKQEDGSWCGPGTVYNMAEIYDYKKYGSYLSAPQYIYAGDLGTSATGSTPFSSIVPKTLNRYILGNNYVLYNAKNNSSSVSDWMSKLKNGVIWTIDKDNGWGGTGYCVAVNMNYNKGSDAADSNNAISGYYANRGIGHWLSVYGYNDNPGWDTPWISDSNGNLEYNGYDTLLHPSFMQLAYASYDRGMVY